ncbi:regulator of G-protein signaling 17 [Musca vetustissima]|uniref:regulator of G-protein signaling 17 n=1 Tax=Musca vetustissima TaxID=27455 RepID=UPI002AB5F81E|nr:regulator of G-protein signaling 17 [Musca vetustissima]
MSCTVSELPSGCRLRGMSSSSQSAANAGSGSGAGSGGNGSGGGGGGRESGGGGGGNGRSVVSDVNTGGIHIGGILSTTNTMGTTTTSGGLTDGTTPLQRQQQQSQKPCCFCWCCCCSCSWAKCLALKNAEDNAPTKRDPGSSDLLLEGEQPSLEEIRSWGSSFEKLMKSPSGRKVFRDFLRSEFSEENILFWLACEDLKKEMNAEAIGEKARLIYEDYISILSPREVSLDARVREIVNRNMMEPTSHTFDEAQIQIYTLMLRDSYPRFINSPKYKTLAQLTDGMSASGSAADSPT